MKRITPYIPRVLLFLALIALAVLVGLLWHKNSTLDDKVTALQQSSVAHQQTDQKLWLQNGKERFGTGLQKIFTTDTADYVYMPELQIRLPYSSFATSIEYAMRQNTGIGGGTKPTEADVTSSQYVAPTTPTVMDCSNLVRIEIKDKANSYSPQEKSYSVTLGDGRTLQIYEFAGDQECQQSWADTASPAQVTAVLKQATAY
jgi:hypothetical protein